jgi:hypothetical protein
LLKVAFLKQPHRRPPSAYPRDRIPCTAYRNKSAKGKALGGRLPSSKLGRNHRILPSQLPNTRRYNPALPRRHDANENVVDGMRAFYSLRWGLAGLPSYIDVEVRIGEKDPLEVRKYSGALCVFHYSGGLYEASTPVVPPGPRRRGKVRSTLNADRFATFSGKLRLVLLTPLGKKVQGQVSEAMTLLYSLPLDFKVRP